MTRLLRQGTHLVNLGPVRTTRISRRAIIRGYSYRATARRWQRCAACLELRPLEWALLLQLDLDLGAQHLIRGTVKRSSVVRFGVKL